MIAYRILAGLAMLALSAWFGHHYAALKYEARDAERLRVIAQLEARQAEKTVEVVTKYVDRVREVRAKAETIINEVPIYVPKAADDRCVIPDGFVRVHDAAATGVPSAARDTYEAASGVALHTVAATVAANYTDCRANAEQLRALQEWVKHGQDVPQH